MASLFARMIKKPHPVSVRYLASVLSVVAALTLTLTARSLFATTAYSLFLAAVMFSSWYGGLTPGLLAILFSVLALDRYFVSPELSGVLTRDDIVHLSVFLLVAGIINHLNRARMRAEKALQDSHRDLQGQVNERTKDIQRANAALRRLSGELMQLQDEERRRMARLLHETVAQSLAALKMDLAVVKRYTHWKDAEGREARQREAIQEASALADDCIREVRTLSYLLHPPLLDEAGLCTALQWYATGFGRRSGIEISLDLPAQLGRLPRNIETAVFRIVQECLTNIHRHAGSPDARIRLNTTDSSVLIEVSDHGHGMPYEMPDDEFGVGIMGMRERVKQFGGHMEIQSGSTGTTVTATLPYGEATYA
jgi:signal transduction histidine kinase